MEQTVISTGIEFTFLRESYVQLDVLDPGFVIINFMGCDDRVSNIQQVHDPVQEYGFVQAVNVAPAHGIDLELRIGNEHYWRGSTKVLTASDVNNQARLLWPNEIFPTTMNQYLIEQCRTVEGQRFIVEDVDTGSSYMLTLKQWFSGSYVWTTYWNKNFVKRRSLKVDDVIGLLWDGTNSKFYFSVRSRSLNNMVNI